RRCLAKEKGERYQSAKDIAHHLRDALAEPAAVQRKPPAWIWIAAAAGIGLPSVLFWLAARPRRRPLSMERLATGGAPWSATISPDGRFVVYVAARGSTPPLWVLQTATGTTTRLTPFADAGGYPAVRISPDGNYIFASVFRGGAMHIFR